MTLTQIVQTVRINKGATIHGKTDKPILSGFVVSPYKSREYPVQLLTEKKIVAFQHVNADLLELPGHHLGFWVNGDDGLTYCDVVIVTNSRDDAQRIARDSNQIAFWHLDTSTEIRTETRESRSERDVNETGFTCG